MKEKLLTIEEVADLLRVKVGVVYRVVRRGKLRAHRVGRRLRFTEAQVDRYLGKVETVYAEDVC
jgi:putative molybdopterin biosynthesis protein